MNDLKDIAKEYGFLFVTYKVCFNQPTIVVRASSQEGLFEKAHKFCNAVSEDSGIKFEFWSSNINSISRIVTITFKEEEEIA